nr:virulence-associated E family protein [Xenococcaceae cyanobacterium MO_234.B1]
TTDPIYDIYLQKWLISLVARVYEPGCKADTMLVLQGSEGIGKSTFFSIIGGDYYDDSMGISLNQDKDALMIAHQSWILEIAELDGVTSQTDAATLQALVTRSTDLYREPYAESVTQHPRRFVLAGTVNNGEFLKESIGSRRLMIIPVAVAQINTVLLIQERDGILANAIQAYLDGQTWYLTQEKQQLQKQLNQGVELSDPWSALIKDYLNDHERRMIASGSKPMVTTRELLTYPLRGKGNPNDTRDAMRVADILRGLGWENLGKKTYQGKRQKVWGKRHTSLEVGRKVGHPETIELKGSDTPAPPAPPNCKEQGVARCDRWGNPSNSNGYINAPPCAPPNCKEQGVARCDRWGKPSKSKGYINAPPTAPPTDPPPVKAVSSPSVTEPVVNDQVVNTNPVQEFLYSEEDIRDIANILSNHPETLCDLQDAFEPGLIQAACQLLPSATVEQLLPLTESVVNDVTRDDNPELQPSERSVKGEITEDIPNDEEKDLYACDVAKIPLQIGNMVKLHSEYGDFLLANRPLGEVIKIERCQKGMKLVVQWEDRRCSDYFVEDDSQRTGSVFLAIKEIRRMVCEDG